MFDCFRLTYLVRSGWTRPTFGISSIFTVPKNKEFNLKTKYTQIGVIEQEAGLRIQDSQGNLINLAEKGYEHNWGET